MKLALWAALLVALASSLGSCAILAGAVIGGAIEHEYQRDREWNNPPYMYRYRYDRYRQRRY
jgi:hypothetical protein